jgi:hypothetical protein
LIRSSANADCTHFSDARESINIADSRNITLTENSDINCNEGIGGNKGIITILPDPTQLIPVIND